MSIYAELGQEHGIRTAVDDFYRRVLADPHLADYFQDADMARLRAHQAALLVQVTGGPVAYSGQELGLAHQGLDVTAADFDRVVAHLADTLTDLGVAEATVAQVGQALTARKSEIVGSPAQVG